MQIETSARSTGELADGITKEPSDVFTLERGQPCPRGHGLPRPGSRRAPFRVRACIGTVNRFESPSPVLRTPSPPVGERDGVRGCLGSWRGRVACRAVALGIGRLFLILGPGLGTP